MPSILICHVPEDGAAARALGAALSERGLRVGFVGDDTRDPVWLSALRIHDGIAVIWSETSTRSAELNEIARAALLENLLISVRANDLDVERIPAEFRKLGTPLIGDVDGIRRVLAQLEARRYAGGGAPAPRRVGAAEAPEVGAAEPRRSPYSPMDIGSGHSPGRFGRVEGVGAGVAVAKPAPVAPQQAALATEAGRLVHKIPQKMWLGEQETVEVRLGRTAAEGLTEGLAGRGPLASHHMPIVETMSVSLYAQGGAFEIERHSETTQLVSGGEQLSGTPFEQANFGRWIWHVTPRRTGSHLLFVRVSASLKDSRGLPASASLPDRHFPVSVSVHAGKASLKIIRSGVVTIAGAAGAGLIGAVTQDLWWPKLRSLLQSWGWL